MGAEETTSSVAGKNIRPLLFRLPPLPLPCSLLQHQNSSDSQDHLLQHPTLQAQSDASLAHQQTWVSQRLFSRRVMELSPRLETESPSSTLVIRRTPPNPRTRATSSTPQLDVEPLSQKSALAESSRVFPPRAAPRHNRE